MELVTKIRQCICVLSDMPNEAWISLPGKGLVVKTLSAISGLRLLQ